MANLSYYSYRTSYGRVTLQCTDSALCRLEFGDCPLKGTHAATVLSNRASTELMEFLAGKRKEFSIPLTYEGTDFQREVWDFAQTIPYGKSMTYAQVAVSLGCESSFRAVGSACNANPIPVFIPCHRIVPASGRRNATTRESKIRSFIMELEAQQI